MRALLALLLFTTMLGCKEKHTPCSGLRFEAVSLPMSFTVSRDGDALGTVTLDASQNATFEAAPGADTDRLAEFETKFAKLTASEQVSYDYSDHDGDKTHFSCSGSTKKGSPEYPEAFKLAIHSDYYDVKD